MARARLTQTVRRARPAPHGRLRCRCRAHGCARAFRILHAGARWHHARAEQRWQLVDDERARKQRLGAADGLAGGLAASELALAADEGAGRQLLTVVAESLGLAWDAAARRTLHRAHLLVSGRA